MVAEPRVDALLPRRPRVDHARPAAGADRHPRLVPHRLARAGRECVPVGGVEVPARRERVVAGRIPGPAVLDLRAADGHDVRRGRRIADDRAGEQVRVLMLLGEARRAEVTGRGEEVVVLRQSLLEDLVELRRLLRGGTPEVLLRRPERHRAPRRRRDLARDRLEHVREPLDALRLGRWNRQEDQVGERSDRVRPLDVERRLARPVCRGARPGLPPALARARELRVAQRVDLLEARVRQAREERVVEDLRSFAAVGLP